MCYKYLIIFFLLFSNKILAQNIESIKQFGGNSIDEGKATCSDRSGNIFISGFFYGTVSYKFGNDSIKASSNGESDVFIAKLNQAGELIWFKTFGGGSYDGVFAITSDLKGNVILTGNFWDTCDFNPSSKIENHVSNGDGDVYVLKLDKNGNFLWVNSFGGREFDNSLGICSDSKNNIYTTGHFLGEFEFKGNDSITKWKSIGHEDAFILKMDSNGKTLWVNFLSGTFLQEGNSIVIDNEDNVIAVGEYSGECLISPNQQNVIFNSIGLIDIYVLKFDSNGQLLWYKSIGGNSYDIVNDVDINSNNEIYIVGSFYESVNFNPPDKNEIKNSKGRFDVFIEKLSQNGNFIWTRTFGGPEPEYVGGFDVDDSGNIYLTGYFEKTCDFSTNSEIISSVSQGSFDVYFLKINDAGDLLTMKTFGGKYDDHGNAICINKKNDIYLTGRFNDKILDDEFEEIENLISNGESDVFILKMNNE